MDRWAYLLFLLYGLLLAADPRFTSAARRDVPLAVIIGVAAWAGSITVFIVGSQTPGVDPLTNAAAVHQLGRGLFGVAGWLWLIAIMGLLARRRRPPRDTVAPRAHPRDNRLAGGEGGWLERFNEAVLPAYVVHQPVVVVIAYFAVGTDLAAPVKFAIICGGSLLTTALIYLLLIKPFQFTRLLFGMQPRPTSTAAAGGD